MSVPLSTARSALLVFALSLALRLLLIPLLPLDPAWQLRQENGATAASLLLSGSYSNPYALPTGPTAHPAPFYTLILALSYQLFGFTHAAEFARCLLAALSFSSLYALLPWLSTRFGLPRRAGLLAGLLGALTPLHLATGLFYGGLGEEFAALALVLLLAASLSSWNSSAPPRPRHLLLGLAWGASFHIVPALLTVFLACLAFETLSLRARLRPALLLLGALLACLPWTLRNYATFHELFFLRSNFGLELRMGNHPGATASMLAMPPAAHPRTDPAEARKLQFTGELEYMRQARREALHWIVSNPADFLRLTAARFLTFWFGPASHPLQALLTTVLTLLALLGARHTLPALSTHQKAALLIPVLAFPLTYYLVAILPRYRVPIDWLILLFAGAALDRLLARLNSNDTPPRERALS